jgi:D-threo-aldose 1-dehydrogenase
MRTSCQGRRIRTVARTAGTIVGVTSTVRLAQVTAWAGAEVPDDVWPELDAARPGPAHWAGELGR